MKAKNIKYCPNCKQPLINMGEFYIHPPSETCDLKDGIEVLIAHKDLFNNFMKLVGKPKKSTEQIMLELEREVEKVIKEQQVLQEKLDKIPKIVKKLFGVETK